jgi:small subunit ribosomal protein S6
MRRPDPLLRDYEILYIVRPDLEEEQLNEAVASVTRLIENLGGTAQKTDVWGRRRLAYEVRHLREGHYVLTDFQIEPARVPEMEATLKISDTVFRHLIVRKPEPSRKNGAGRGTARSAAASAPAAEPGPTPAVGPVPAGAAESAEPEATDATEVLDAAPATEPAEAAPAAEPSAEASSELPAEPAPEPAAGQAAAEEPES